jgi:hypothetical protein
LIKRYEVSGNENALIHAEQQPDTQKIFVPTYIKALVSVLRMPRWYMATTHVKQQIRVRNTRKEYGPIYRERRGHYKTVFVFDPDVVQQVFRNEGKYPAREPDLPMWSKHKKDRGQSEGVSVSL